MIFIYYRVRNFIMKLAIIGAGVSGLIALSRFKNNYQCTLYESTNHVSGVWTTSQDNEINLQIEPKIYRLPTTSYYPTSKQGGDVYRYISKFCQMENLYSYIKFKHRVVNIITNKDGTFKLLLYQIDQRIYQYSEDYHFVICTGNTSRPKIPAIFLHQPNIYHTFNLNNKLIDSFQGKKIVVVGGSKSSADAILRLYQNNTIIWLAREFNSFAKKTDYTTLSLNRLFTCGFFHRLDQSCLTEYKVYEKGNHKVGSFNLLSPEEYQVLRNQIQKRVGEVTYLTSNFVVTDQGDQIAYDYIILGTGYKQSYCPSKIINNRLINITTHNQGSILFASQFCGYSILVDKLKHYLKSGQYHNTTFKAYLKDNSSLIDYVYQLEYYVGFTFFPTRKMVNYHHYSRRLTIRLVYLSIIILFIYFLRVYYF